jgi:hypothetical protein
LMPAFLLPPSSDSNPSKKRSWSRQQTAEAVISSDTPVDIQLITRRYITEDMTLHTHCCENHNSKKINEVSALLRAYHVTFCISVLNIFCYHVSKCSSSVA